MVCANSDIVVQRGDTLVYCAGALADAYAALGGEVLLIAESRGPRIYDAALAAAAGFRCGTTPARNRVLADGDFLVRSMLRAPPVSGSIIILLPRASMPLLGARGARHDRA